MVRDFRIEVGMGRATSHERRRELLERAIASAAPAPGQPFACPYLPGRSARHLAVRLEPGGPGLYHALMDLNFRRLGGLFYRPECDSCSECRMIRVLASEFRPNRSQRRCLKKNADLSIRITRPAPSDEKLALYRRYLESRHDGQMEGSAAEMQGFLYESPIETWECEYRLDRRLIGIGIFDVEPRTLSAVYCYYEPELAGRALGVFNVLRLLEECRRRKATHLYLGYYVADCQKMSYKANYRPCEILEPGGRFSRLG